MDTLRSRLASASSSGRSRSAVGVGRTPQNMSIAQRSAPALRTGRPNSAPIGSDFSCGPRAQVLHQSYGIREVRTPPRGPAGHSKARLVPSTAPSSTPPPGTRPARQAFFQPKTGVDCAPFVQDVVVSKAEASIVCSQPVLPSSRQSHCAPLTRDQGTQYEEMVEPTVNSWMRAPLKQINLVVTKAQHTNDWSEILVAPAQHVTLSGHGNYTKHSVHTGQMYSDEHLFHWKEDFKRLSKMRLGASHRNWKASTKSYYARACTENAARAQD